MLEWYSTLSDPKFEFNFDCNNKKLESLHTKKKKNQSKLKEVNFGRMKRSAQVCLDCPSNSLLHFHELVEESGLKTHAHTLTLVLSRFLHVFLHFFFDQHEDPLVQNWINFFDLFETKLSRFKINEFSTFIKEQYESTKTSTNSDGNTYSLNNLFLEKTNKKSQNSKQKKGRRPRNKKKIFDLADLIYGKSVECKNSIRAIKDKFMKEKIQIEKNLRKEKLENIDKTEILECTESILQEIKEEEEMWTENKVKESGSKIQSPRSANWLIFQKLQPFQSEYLEKRSFVPHAAQMKRNSFEFMLAKSTESADEACLFPNMSAHSNMTHPLSINFQNFLLLLVSNLHLVDLFTEAFVRNPKLTINNMFLQIMLVRLAKMVHAPETVNKLIAVQGFGNEVNRRLTECGGFHKSLLDFFSIPQASAEVKSVVARTLLLSIINYHRLDFLRISGHFPTRSPLESCFYQFGFTEKCVLFSFLEHFDVALPENLYYQKKNVAFDDFESEKEDWFQSTEKILKENAIQIALNLSPSLPLNRKMLLIHSVFEWLVSDPSKSLFIEQNLDWSKQLLLTLFFIKIGRELVPNDLGKGSRMGAIQNPKPPIQTENEFAFNLPSDSFSFEIFEEQLKCESEEKSKYNFECLWILQLVLFWVTRINRFKSGFLGSSERVDLKKFQVNWAFQKDSIPKNKDNFSIINETFKTNPQKYFETLDLGNSQRAGGHLAKWVNRLLLQKVDFADYVRWSQINSTAEQCKPVEQPETGPNLTRFTESRSQSMKLGMAVTIHNTLSRFSRHSQIISRALRLHLCSVHSRVIHNNSRIRFLEKKIICSLNNFAFFHNFCLRLRIVLREYRRHQFMFLTFTLFATVWLIVYLDFLDLAKDEYALFLLEVFLKFANLSLLIHLAWLSLLLFLLVRVTRSLEALFSSSLADRHVNTRSLVNTIIHYILVNMWRLSFSDLASFYEYNYLDLFSELLLLGVCLLLCEPIKPVHCFWNQVL